MKQLLIIPFGTSYDMGMLVQPLQDSFGRLYLSIAPGTPVHLTPAIEPDLFISDFYQDPDENGLLIDEFGGEDAYDALAYLHQHYPTSDILAVSDYRLLQDHFFRIDQLHGVCSEKTGKMIISTERFKDYPQIRFGQLIKIALHEVGHQFQLDHHCVLLPDDRYCPMYHSLDTEQDKDLYADPKEFDSIGIHFCRDCTKTLKQQECL